MSTTSGRWRGSNNAYRRGGATRPGVPRGAWVNQLGRRPLDVERPPSPPLGDLVARIDEDELVQSSDSFEASAKITDCEDVTSYNWLNREQPTILIPGTRRAHGRWIATGSPPADLRLSMQGNRLRGHRSLHLSNCNKMMASTIGTRMPLAILHTLFSRQWKQF